MRSCIFSIITQSSVPHYPSEIIIICWFDAQETFIIIIINVENSSYFASYFSGNCDNFYVRIFDE